MALVRAPEVPVRLACTQRVIYGDTDRMGVVYHATYLRFMEHARVEFMRGMGAVYSELERKGLGLPVTDLAVTYLSPARYDDIVSCWVGVTRLGHARLDFAYRLTLEPGDRAGESDPNAETRVLLHAQTRHGCIDLEKGQVTRIPDFFRDRIAAAMDDGSSEG